MLIFPTWLIDKPAWLDHFHFIDSEKWTDSKFIFSVAPAGELLRFFLKLARSASQDANTSIAGVFESQLVRVDLDLWDASGEIWGFFGTSSSGGAGPISSRNTVTSVGVCLKCVKNIPDKV
jgi:hypothetical protein